MTLRFSLKLTKVYKKPIIPNPQGEITYNHRLKTSEVYYILKGRGIMYIDDESAEVKKGQAVYIPPNSNKELKILEMKI